MGNDFTAFSASGARARRVSEFNSVDHGPWWTRRPTSRGLVGAFQRRARRFKVRDLRPQCSRLRASRRAARPSRWRPSCRWAARCCAEKTPARISQMSTIVRDFVSVPHPLSMTCQRRSNSRWDRRLLRAGVRPHRQHWWHRGVQRHVPAATLHPIIVKLGRRRQRIQRRSAERVRARVALRERDWL
jgi:hypothetical protein